jgi:DNA gyrase inhibitor GyrI
VKSRIVYLRPLQVAYIRRVGPYAVSAKQAWERVFQICEEKGVRAAAGPGYGLLRDDPHQAGPDKARYDACIALKPELGLDLAGVFGVQTLPGGAFLRVNFKGDPSEAGSVLSRLYRAEAHERGLRVDTNRPFLEIYPVDPGSIDVTEVKMDLCVPVAI